MSLKLLSLSYENSLNNIRSSDMFWLLIDFDPLDVNILCCYINQILFHPNMLTLWLSKFHMMLKNCAPKWCLNNNRLPYYVDDYKYLCDMLKFISFHLFKRCNKYWSIFNQSKFYFWTGLLFLCTWCLNYYNLSGGFDQDFWNFAVISSFLNLC